MHVCTDFARSITFFSPLALCVFACVLASVCGFLGRALLPPLLPPALSMGVWSFSSLALTSPLHARSPLCLRLRLCAPISLAVSVSAGFGLSFLLLVALHLLCWDWGICLPPPPPLHTAPAWPRISALFHATQPFPPVLLVDCFVVVPPASAFHSFSGVPASSLRSLYCVPSLSWPPRARFPSPLDSLLSRRALPCYFRPQLPPVCACFPYSSALYSLPGFHGFLVFCPLPLRSFCSGPVPAWCACPPLLAVCFARSPQLLVVFPPVFRFVFVFWVSLVSSLSCLPLLPQASPLPPSSAPSPSWFFCRSSFGQSVRSLTLVPCPPARESPVFLLFPCIPCGHWCSLAFLSSIPPGPPPPSCFGLFWLLLGALFGLMAAPLISLLWCCAARVCRLSSRLAVCLSSFFVWVLFLSLVPYAPFSASLAVFGTCLWLHLISCFALFARVAFALFFSPFFSVFLCFCLLGPPVLGAVALLSLLAFGASFPPSPSLGPDAC